MSSDNEDPTGRMEDEPVNASYKTASSFLISGTYQTTSPLASTDEIEHPLENDTEHVDYPEDLEGQPSACTANNFAPDDEDIVLSEFEEEHLIARAPPQPPTQKREFLAWIIYDFASGVFPSVAMQVFIPLVLDGMARAVGRVPGTENTPCQSEPGVAVGLDQDSKISTSQAAASSADSSPCEVRLGTVWISTVSFVLYVTAISVILQALTFISLGVLADFGNWRKNLLFIFSLLSIITAVLFLTVISPDLFWLAAIYTILANVFYGATTVFYNAYLGVLVRNHPAVLNLEENIDLKSINYLEFSLLGLSQKFKSLVKKVKNPLDKALSGLKSNLAEDKVENAIEEEMKEIKDVIQEERPTLQDLLEVEHDPPSEPIPLQETPIEVTPKVAEENLLNESYGLIKRKSKARSSSRERLKQKTRVENHLSNTLSTHGLAAAYLANLFLLLISFGIILSRNNDTYALQICIAVSGIWWFVFSIYTWKNLHPRPGPPLPKSAKNFIWFSWKKTFYAVKHFKRLPNTFLYLVAYFIFSDALSTIGQIAILFARSNAQMTDTQIAIAVAITPIGALFGVYFWLWLSRRLQWTTKRTLMVLLCIGCLLPTYGLLGYINVTGKVQLGPQITLGFGLSSSLEMYVAVVLFGSLFAPILSFSRVLFTDVVPKGKESEFFALYEISDRGTSWIGPLVVGALAGPNGNLRAGFGYVLFTLILPLCMMYWLIDIPKAKKECEVFVLEEERRRQKIESKFHEKRKQKLDKLSNSA
ncbi:hypothetical protein MP638_001203 [Amoeboaphelidium occidentale]|nr:hypothetical protein MP638_001203 [Amoeboaphelidium occidentale]